MKPNVISFFAVFGACVLGQWIVSATLHHEMQIAGCFVGSILWVGITMIIEKTKGVREF